MNWMTGFHAVEEALAAGRPLDRIVIARGRHGERVEAVVRLAKSRGAPVRFEHRKQLARLAGTREHQGIAALAAARPTVELEDLLRAKVPQGLLVMLDGIEDPLVLRVRQATRPSAVVWDVGSCPFLPDWEGTTPGFRLSRSGKGGCDVEFRHVGLSPQLSCYEMCRAGWDQYLPSLRDYLQTCTGNPYTPARQG